MLGELHEEPGQLTMQVFLFMTTKAAGAHHGTDAFERIKINREVELVPRKAPPEGPPIWTALKPSLAALPVSDVMPPATP